MMRMLHIASKFTRNKLHLEHVYKTFVRSRLEYASSLWHSSLTVANRSDIERIQKSAMKVIFKNDYHSYARSLKILRIESLQDRRERLSLNFAKKCLKQNKMSHMIREQVQKKTMKNTSLPSHFKNIPRLDCTDFFLALSHIKPTFFH